MSTYPVAGNGWMGLSAPGPGEFLRQWVDGYVLPGLTRRLDRLERDTLRVLSAWMDTCTRPYLSYSGGKDSTVLLDIVRTRWPEVEAIYLADAEGSAPEVVDMLAWARSWGHLGELEWGSFFEAYREHGLEAGAIDRLYGERVITKAIALGYDGCARGIRAAESAGRERHARYNGPGPRERACGGFWDCDPLLDWTSDDVWAYLVTHRLPYAACYDTDDGIPRPRRRVGTLWGTTAMSHGRIVRLRRFYPEAYRRFAAAIPEIARYS